MPEQRSPHLPVPFLSRIAINHVLVIFSLCVVAFTAFYKLGDYPIFIWDEAIYADNALEMAISGDPMVLRLDGQPNTYNSKPPFVIWMQSLAVKVFGPNEFAIRLPSALAALGTSLLLILFSHKVLRDSRIGAVAVLMLATTPGYVRAHVTRTGDLDAMLVLWITFYSLVFIAYLLRKPTTYKPYFFWMTAGIVLAFYTKSVAAFLPLPGLVLISIFDNSFTHLIRKAYVWKCAIIAIAACVLFYVIREWVSPGYLDVTYHSEYTRFFTNIMPWHEHPTHFYVRNWFFMQFLLPHVYLLPVAILFSLLANPVKKAAVYLLVFSLTYLAVISYPAVKLEWYDAPLYPILSLLMGIGVINAFQFAANSKLSWMKWLVVIIAFIFIAWGFSKVLYRLNHNLNLPVDPLEREGRFMRALHASHPKLTSYDVLMVVKHPAHLTQAKFYSTAFAMQEMDVRVVDNLDSITIGSHYLFCQDTVQRFISSHYVVDSIAGQEMCKLVRVTDISTKPRSIINN